MRTVRAAASCLVMMLLASACGKDPEAQAREHFERANGYFTRQAYKEAIIEYKNVLQLSPRHGAARLRLAESYEQTGEIAGAFQEYVRSADVLTEDEALQLKVGRLLVGAGRFEDAKARARMLLDANPSNVDAHILLANASAGLKDFDVAMKELEDAVRMEPSAGQGYADMGVIHMTQGRAADAEAAFRRAVELEPTSVPARLAAANFFWTIGDRDEARRQLEAARAVDPANPLTNRALATLSIVSGRAADAERYVKALAAAATDSAGRMLLADYYRSLQRMDDALGVLKELAEDEATRFQALVRMAAIQAGTNTAEAFKTLETVLAARPQDADALTLSAALLLQQGKADDALARAEAAVDAHPDHALASLVLGDVRAARGDVAGARRAFEEVLRLNPRAQPARLRLARIHLSGGKADTASMHARDVIAADARNLDARLLLVAADIAQGRLGDAERTLEALLAEFPAAAAVHAANGTLAHARRDTQAARAAYRRALALSPHDLGATEGLVRLDLDAGRPADARARVEGIVKARRNDAAALLLAGRTFVAVGDLAEAEGAFRRAVAADPAAIDGYVGLARLYASQRKLAQARAEFGEAIRRQPASVPAHTMLGMLFEAEGRRADAEKAYETALSHDGDAAVAANNLAWILVDSARDLDRALALAQTAYARLGDNAQVQDTLGWSGIL